MSAAAIHGQQGSGAAPGREIRRAVAFVADSAPTLATALDRALAARHVLLNTRTIGIDAALAQAHDSDNADCVIVDIRDAPDAIDDVAALQSVLPRHCRLVAIAERVTSGLHRDLIDAGAYAVLDGTLRPDALDAVFGAATVGDDTMIPGTKPRHRGRVVAVLGTRGGVGATTIAVGLGWLMAHELGRETALVDLDPYFGSMALALNLEPGDGLRQALERPSRLDSVFVDRAVRRFGDRLYVMCSEQALDQALQADSGAPLALLDALRAQYERVVVDVPRGNPAWQRAVLGKADEVVLVTDLSLAGARDAMRLLAFARNCSDASRIRVLIGGARQPQNDMLDLAEFRRAVGAPVETAIPFDARAAMDAGRLGRPLPKAAGRSAAGKAYRGLLTALEGAGEKEPRRWTLPWRR